VLDIVITWYAESPAWKIRLAEYRAYKNSVDWNCCFLTFDQRQTQTYFFFIWPSIQSRELWSNFIKNTIILKKAFFMEKIIWKFSRTNDTNQFFDIKNLWSNFKVFWGHVFLIFDPDTYITYIATNAFYFFHIPSLQAREYASQWYMMMSN